MGNTLLEQCVSSGLIDVTMVAFRGIVLVGCAIGGILSIYLGWRLYADSMLAKTEGTAHFSNMRFRLVSAGPGVFFAAFGMWLLVSLSKQTVQLNDQVGLPANSGSTQAVPSPSGFSQMPPALSQPRFLRVQASSNQINSSNTCLVRKRSRSFFVGDQKINPKEISDDLSFAIQTVAKQIDDDASIDDPGNRQRRHVISTLKSLQDGLVNE
jgi:hypothetical protein